jgi:hypothetical protein
MRELAAAALVIGQYKWAGHELSSSYMGNAEASDSQAKESAQPDESAPVSISE